ncbi:G- coupled receptor 157-like [Paramuricea clavata]|uniref:G- coupled receptor 157-like n=1 Tax=Paramuricea clavata TaxID=317549 RepID=A0A6S7JUG5_PARCT|nr:G- coupled receptor 157-like [Paramuricea clavata]
MFTPENFLANSTTTNLVNSSTTTVGSDHDTDDETANVITTTIGGGLSMIGVIFIVFSYFKLLEYRAGGTTAQTILLFISTADFIAACSNVVSVWIPARSDTAACKTGGFLIIFATTSSFFWTSCLAIHLYLIIMNKSHLVSHKKKMLIFHIVSWGLPLLFGSVALGCKALGPSPENKNESLIKLTTGGWCWIRDFHDKKKNIAWTMMTSKIWELSSYLLITVLCILIFIQLRFKIKTTDSISEDTLAEARKVERRMMFIPVAFVLLRVWGTVRYFAYVSELPIRAKVLQNMPLYALQVGAFNKYTV